MNRQRQLHIDPAFDRRRCRDSVVASLVECAGGDAVRAKVHAGNRIRIHNLDVADISIARRKEGRNDVLAAAPTAELVAHFVSISSTI